MNILYIRNTNESEIIDFRIHQIGNTLEYLYFVASEGGQTVTYTLLEIIRHSHDHQAHWWDSAHSLSAG